MATFRARIRAGIRQPDLPAGAVRTWAVRGVKGNGRHWTPTAAERLGRALVLLPRPPHGPWQPARMFHTVEQDPNARRPAAAQRLRTPDQALQTLSGRPVKSQAHSPRRPGPEKTFDSSGPRAQTTAGSRCRARRRWTISFPGPATPPTWATTSSWLTQVQQRQVRLLGG